MEAVDSTLVRIAEDSHENARAHFGDSTDVVVVRKCDAPHGLGLVGVHEGRFLATIGRDWAFASESWGGKEPGSASRVSKNL